MALYFSVLSSELPNRCCRTNTPSASGAQARLEHYCCSCGREGRVTEIQFSIHTGLKQMY